MWLERFRVFWTQRLDALATELARGKRERRTAHAADSAATTKPTTGDDDSDSDNDKEVT